MHGWAKLNCSEDQDSLNLRFLFRNPWSLAYAILSPPLSLLNWPLGLEYVVKAALRVSASPTRQRFVF